MSLARRYGTVETEGSVGGMLSWGRPARISFSWAYAVLASVLTVLEITETNYSQSVLPVGQIGGRGAEDSKNPTHF